MLIANNEIIVEIILFELIRNNSFCLWTYKIIFTYLLLLKIMYKYNMKWTI